MKSSTHVVQPFLPVAAVKLGRFIASTEQPHQNFTDPPVSNPQELVTIQENFHQLLQDGKGKLVKSEASGIFSVSAAKSAQQEQQLSTALATIYQLQNSDAWFDEAIQQQEIRKWIEKAVRSTGRIFLVVGYKTVQDAATAQRQSKSAAKDTTISIPVVESAAMALTMAPVGLPVVPSGGPGNPGAEWKNQTDSMATQTFNAPGEQVTEIQVRRLKFKFLSSKDLDQSRLEGKARWKSDWRVRGIEHGKNDVIEVKLIDEEDSDNNDSSDDDL